MYDLVGPEDVKGRSRNTSSNRKFDIESISTYLGLDKTILQQVLASDIKNEKEWKAITREIIHGELVDGLFLWHDDCKEFFPLVCEKYIMSARCKDAPKGNGADKARCIRCTVDTWVVSNLRHKNFEGVVCEKCVNDDQPRIVMIDAHDNNFVIPHKVGITNRDVYRSYVAKPFIGKRRSGTKGKYELIDGDLITHYFSIRIPGLIKFECKRQETANIQSTLQSNESDSTKNVQSIQNDKIEYADTHEQIKTEQSKTETHQTRTLKDDLYEKIEKFVEDTKNKGNIYMDEASTKQTIILRLFNCLGWDTFNLDEVVPEYNVGGIKVDYLLKASMRYKVFVEVKKFGENLIDEHQEQLSLYNSKEVVDLCILTNGLAYWFYLPREKGKWDEKRFYAIDIMRQDPKDVASKFYELLSKHNISNGNAIAKANKLYAGKQKDTEINKGFPIALKKMLEGENDKFLQLLIDETESICGYRPDPEQSKKLLLKHRNRV